MKKLILTSIALLFVLLALKAQTGGPIVISSSGGTGSIGNNTLDWTFGEIAVGTMSSAQTTLTQGFQQSFVLKVETSIDLPHVEVSVYPNPTSDFLQVSTENLPQTEFYLSNLQGNRVLEIIKPVSNQTIIDMSGYSEGIYMLQIIDQSSGQKEVIKIIKN